MLVRFIAVHDEYSLTSSFVISNLLLKCSVFFIFYFVLVIKSRLIYIQNQLTMQQAGSCTTFNGCGAFRYLPFSPDCAVCARAIGNLLLDQIHAKLTPVQSCFSIFFSIVEPLVMGASKTSTGVCLYSLKTSPFLNGFY